MTKIQRIPFALGVPILLLSACSPSTSSSSQGSSGGTITMGELLALTGRLPVVGQNILVGSEDGVYEVNHNGGVLGKTLKPVSADTGGDPVDAVTAFHQLALSNPVFISGPTSLEIDGV